MSDIKSFGFGKNMLSQWRSNIGMLLGQNMRFLRFTQTQDIGSKIILQSSNLFLIYVSSHLVFDGELTLGSLFAVMYIIGMLNTPLQHIGEFMNQFQLTHISLQRLLSFNMLDQSENGHLSTFPKSRDLSLLNISFRYPGSEWILKSMSLVFKKGMKYGIVGDSGSGKSTLLKVVSGLYPSSGGAYMIGSTNIKGIHPRQISDVFSSCLQDSSVIEGTILENIVVDCENFDESRLIKCVEVASIRREIECLPKSYDTHVSPNNPTLSKGQIQRILIARTLYKKADIYLFDEVTNCLGEEIGRKIINKIDVFLNDKTRIFTTHKSEILTDSHSIYCIQAGQIYDFGTYEELHKRERI